VRACGGGHVKVSRLRIPEVLLLEPRVFGDERGFLFESFNQRRFAEAVGKTVTFVQDNHSLSSKGVLRGLHYQIRFPQGKLIRVVAGEIFDVAVDLRRESATFGKWVGAVLNAQEKRQLWIPPGFAHGFLTLSESAETLYKATDYWAPEDERCVRWDDPTIGIQWPTAAAPILSERDRRGLSLTAAEVFSFASW